MVFLHLSLPFFLLPALVLAQDPIHLNLVRRSPRGAVDYAKEADKLRHRYGYASAQRRDVYPSRPGRRASSDIPIVNQNSDSSYFSSLSIGTPPQRFNVILDTGSADLWLADSSCSDCNTRTPRYQPDSSSTFSASNGAFGSSVTIRYGSGDVSGFLASDTVSLGGFTIPNQVFLAVDNMTSGLLVGSVSGIMGLAFQTIASTRAPPFWQALSSGGQLTEPEMSFWLTRQIDDFTASEEEPGGVFTLGGTNSSLYTGDIEFLNLPVRTPSFWLLPLQSAVVNGEQARISTGTSALAAIDTGTTLIGGPSSDVTAIWSMIPNSARSASNPGFFTFPCSTRISINLSFGGKSWPINPVDMNLGQVARGSSQCLGAIFDLSMGSNIPPGTGNPNWVIGDTFLKNVNSVFRATPPSIGFAQLSDAAGGSGAGAPLSTVSTSILTSSSDLLPSPTESIAVPTLLPPDTTGTPGNGTTPNPTGRGGAITQNLHTPLIASVISVFALFFML